MRHENQQIHTWEQPTHKKITLSQDLNSIVNCNKTTKSIHLDVLKLKARRMLSRKS